MSEAPISADQAKPVIPVYGAYEDIPEDTETNTPGYREHLITSTRIGRLLKEGDAFPQISSINAIAGENEVILIHVVNAFDTPKCTECTNEVEELSKKHPGIKVISVNIENADSINIEDEKEGQITHPRISITRKEAIDLGVLVKPGKEASKDFWPKALRRSLFVRGSDGKITFARQHRNQDQKPDFKAAFQAAELAKAA